MTDRLFPPAKPEEMGVSSKQILSFIRKAEDNGIMMHSMLLMRKNHVIAEGYYAPFTQDSKHRMYSVSKTFAGTAIGLLADEGRISLDDRVADYFEDKLPENPHPYIMDMRIRDLLKMSTAHPGSTTGVNDPDWAWTFFNKQPTHPPGTLFNYDTSGTYILDVIVERVTGQPFLEYMKDRMLRDLGFSEDAWCVKAPEGYSWGGSGVICTTRDAARLGLVYMGNGLIGETRYLSESFVREATTKQIDNSVSGHRNYIQGNGYGYQIWMLKDGGFGFIGMGMQLVICLPKHDLLFVCTGDTQGATSHYAGVMELLWSEIVEHLEADELPEDPEAAEELSAKLQSLKVICPLIGDANTPHADKINGKTYVLNPNPMDISELSVELDEDEGVLIMQKSGIEKRIAFGLDAYVHGAFPETHYFGDTIRKPSNREYRYMATARWTEDAKLVIRSYLIDDYFGNLTITLGWKGDEIGVAMQKTAEWFLNEYQGVAGGRFKESVPSD